MTQAVLRIACGRINRASLSLASCGAHRSDSDGVDGKLPVIWVLSASEAVCRSEAVSLREGRTDRSHAEKEAVDGGDRSVRVSVFRKHRGVGIRI